MKSGADSGRSREALALVISSIIMLLLYYSVENAKRFRQNNGVLKCGTPKCVPNDYQNLKARRTFQL